MLGRGHPQRLRLLVERFVRITVIEDDRRPAVASVFNLVLRDGVAYDVALAVAYDDATRRHHETQGPRRIVEVHAASALKQRHGQQTFMPRGERGMVSS